MKLCDEYRRNLADLAWGEGDPGRAEATMSHAKECPDCRDEERRLRRVLEAAAARRENAEREMARIDWEGLAGRIADTAARRQPARAGARTAPRRGLAGFLFRPALAYLFAGLVLGGLATYGAFRAGLFTPRPRGGYFMPRDLLDKTEAEFARRETVSYLERSQYLLLDFAQTPPDQASTVWGPGGASSAAADLLSRKKFIDPQLEKVPMAKAREICDQIEALCLELSQVGGRLTPAEWREIQDRVRESQLLLKIDLVKKELEHHEL